MMTKYIVLAAVCVVVTGNPPVSPRLYQHLQNDQSLDYFMENYYNRPSHQKQGNIEGGAPARLENLEPDSEVEILPGAQQPQQPPQQAPVAPNLPGLIPGQRVFIVHMPVPGYRPGTVGGYQPIYIVAAAPQGNAGYPAPNGYQNAILLNPINQGYSPFLGYPGLGQISQQGAAGLFLGPYNRPLDPYQEPAFLYQPNPQGANSQAQTQPLAHTGRNAGGQVNAAAEEPKRIGQSSEVSESLESKEDMELRRPSSGRSSGPKVNRKA